MAAWKNYILTGDPEHSPPTWPHRTIEISDPFLWPIEEPPAAVEVPPVAIEEPPAAIEVPPAALKGPPAAIAQDLPTAPPIEGPQATTSSTDLTPQNTSTPLATTSSPKPCRTGPFRPAVLAPDQLPGQLLGTFGTYKQCANGILRRPWPENPKYTEVLVPGGLLYATMSDRALASAKRIPVIEVVRRRLVKQKLAGPEDHISILPAYPRRDRKPSDPFSS